MSDTNKQLRLDLLKGMRTRAAVELPENHKISGWTEAAKEYYDEHVYNCIKEWNNNNE